MVFAIIKLIDYWGRESLIKKSGKEHNYSDDESSEGGEWYAKRNMML